MRRADFLWRALTRHVTGRSWESGGGASPERKWGNSRRDWAIARPAGSGREPGVWGGPADGRTDGAWGRTGRGEGVAAGPELPGRAWEEPRPLPPALHSVPAVSVHRGRVTPVRHSGLRCQSSALCQSRDDGRNKEPKMRDGFPGAGALSNPKSKVYRRPEHPGSL